MMLTLLTITRLSDRVVNLLACSHFTLINKFGNHCSLPSQARVQNNTRYTRRYQTRSRQVGMSIFWMQFDNSVRGTVWWDPSENVGSWYNLAFVDEHYVLTYLAAIYLHATMCIPDFCCFPASIFSFYYTKTDSFGNFAIFWELTIVHHWGITKTTTICFCSLV